MRIHREGQALRHQSVLVSTQALHQLVSILFPSLSYLILLLSVLQRPSLPMTFSWQMQILLLQPYRRQKRVRSLTPFLVCLLFFISLYLLILLSIPLAPSPLTSPLPELTQPPPPSSPSPPHQSIKPTSKRRTSSKAKQPVPGDSKATRASRTNTSKADPKGTLFPSWLLISLLVLTFYAF